MGRAQSQWPVDWFSARRLQRIGLISIQMWTWGVATHLVEELVNTGSAGAPEAPVQRVNGEGSGGKGCCYRMHVHGVRMRRVKLPKIFTLFSSMSRSFPCSNRRFWLTVLVVARFSSNRSFADSYLINSVRYAPRPRPHPSESSATMRLHVSQLSLQLHHTAFDSPNYSAHTACAQPILRYVTPPLCSG